jgi:hypothetical protein
MSAERSALDPCCKTLSTGKALSWGRRRVNDLTSEQRPPIHSLCFRGPRLRREEVSLRERAANVTSFLARWIGRPLRRLLQENGSTASIPRDGYGIQQAQGSGGKADGLGTAIALPSPGPSGAARQELAPRRSPVVSLLFLAGDPARAFLYVLPPDTLSVRLGNHPRGD